MAVAAGKKYLNVFSNELAKITAVYDFAEDGGAQGAFELFEASEDLVIVAAKVKIKTTFTSGGAATLIIGQTGDTDSIMQSLAVASATAGVVKDCDAAALALKLASGDKVSMTIGTADMTAGKLEVELYVSKF